MGALLGDNPTINPGASGFYLCGDPSQANKWLFNFDDILATGFGIPKDGADHLEVDFIVTGKKVKVKIYDGDHCSSWFQNAVKIDAGDSLVLKSVAYKKNDKEETWDNVVKSFIMYTDDSDEEAIGSKWDRDSAVCLDDSVNCSEIARKKKRVMMMLGVICVVLMTMVSHLRMQRKKAMLKAKSEKLKTVTTVNMQTQTRMKGSNIRIQNLVPSPILLQQRCLTGKLDRRRRELLVERLELP